MRGGKKTVNIGFSEAERKNWFQERWEEETQIYLTDQPGQPISFPVACTYEFWVN